MSSIDHHDIIRLHDIIRHHDIVIAGGFAEKEIRAVLSTDLAKHPAGHAVMAELGKAELAVDIAPHPGLKPLRTLRWTRSAAVESTASQVLITSRQALRRTLVP